MKVKKNDRFRTIRTNKNRIALCFGKAKRIGLFGGVQYYERFDWNHIDIGLTVACFYFTLSFRWRVANCGYEKSEPYVD